jgi:hypothetical protein
MDRGYDKNVEHYNDVDHYKRLLKEKWQQKHNDDDTDEDVYTYEDEDESPDAQRQRKLLIAARSKNASGWRPPNNQDEKKGGGKRKSKGNSKKVSKKPVVSQKKQSIYKEILGKQMKIYKMPDSRKEYVKYKGDLLHISDYKDLMKQKAMVKTKVPKATRQKAKSKIQEIKYKNR